MLGLRLRTAFRAPPALYCRLPRSKFYSSPPPSHPSGHPSDSRVILASLDSGPNPEAVQPVSIDAKGQAKIAFRTFGSIFKAFLYGSLGLGAVASLAFVGLHLWVEHFELPPGQRDDGHHEEEYHWEDEVEGWGAGYLGKGSDSRFGWRARSLIRAAWVARNWQSGQVAVSDEAPEINGSRRLIDSAYALAGDRLQQAIFMAKEVGLRLDERHPPDRGLVELQNRLADICERMDTPFTLMKALQIYKQIWGSCVASMERAEGPDPETWETRQAIWAAWRLGHVGLKLARLSDSPHSKPTGDDCRTAEQYLVWAASTGLGMAVGDGQVFRSSFLKKGLSTSDTEEKKPTSLLSRLGRHFVTSDPSVSLKLHDPLKSEVGLIEHTLEALTRSNSTGVPTNPIISASPAVIRATVSSLIRLSCHLASIDADTAHQVQSMMQRFLRSIIPSGEVLSKASSDAMLHHLWMRSREALASVYLAELGHTSQKLDDPSVIQLCQSALESLDGVLLALQTDAEVFRSAGTRHASGRLAEQAKALKRDVRMTAAMASNTIGLKLETCLQDELQKRKPSWCGLPIGRLSPQDFFRRAIQYSIGTTEEDEKLVQLWQESSKNLAYLETRGKV